MARLDTDRNPNCSFAVTLEDLKNSLNYHSMHTGSDGIWSPFLIINEDDKAVQHDAFLPNNDAIDGDGWWTWGSMEDMDNSRPADLRSLGIIAWEDGHWSENFCVFDSDAYKIIRLIWEEP